MERKTGREDERGMESQWKGREERWTECRGDDPLGAALGVSRGRRETFIPWEHIMARGSP